MLGSEKCGVAATECVAYSEYADPDDVFSMQIYASLVLEGEVWLQLPTMSLCTIAYTLHNTSQG